MTDAGVAPHRGWIRRNLAWLLFLLMLAIFTAGRLVGPRVPDDEQKKWCVVNVHISAHLGVSLNCDAPEFMRLAAHPAELLKPTTPRQTRPGLPVAAWLVAQPLEPLVSLVPRMVTKAERADIDPARISGALQSFGAAYVAYVVLNLLILCASFHVFRRIYQVHQPTDEPETVAIVAVSFATLMIATFPVTTHLLSPHTQLFNTLVPLLALLFAMRAHNGALEDVRFAAMVGAIVGFGQTAYAVFVLVAMIVVLFAGVHWIRNRRGAATLLLLRNAAVLGALSIAPTIMWYGIVLMSGNELHFHEVEADKSFVWIVTSLQESGEHLRSEVARRFQFQLDGLISLLPMIEVMTAVTLGFLAAAAVGPKRDRMVLRPAGDTWSTFAIALIVALIFFVFYVGVGTFQVRLSYASLPPLIAAGAALATMFAGRLPTVWRRLFGAACGAVALVALALAVTEGPHSMGRWFD
jgi:hypothetical protein